MGDKTVRRAAEIAWVLSTYLAFYKLTRHRRKPLGVRLREAFERLGTAFIKIGQILSLRYDLLGKKDCDELHKLLDSVPPFDTDIAREVFKHDLGAYPEEIFASFEREPFSAASIAQVHHARLKDGTSVAVKIRRPWIGKPIERDAIIFRRIVQIAQLISPTLRRIGFARAYEEINAALLKEIDLRNEAEHLRLFSRQLEERPYTREGIGRIVVPEVFDEFSSYNVLTMTFLEGIPLREWRETDRARGYDALSSVNTVFSHHVVWLFGDDDFYLHGDLHPANFIVMKDGDMGLIDFGILGLCSGRVAGLISDAFFAIYLRDADAATKGAFEMVGIRATHKIIEEHHAEMARFIEKAHQGNVAYWLMGIMEILGRYRFDFPIDAVLIARGQIMLDGVIHMLDPARKTTDFIGPEFEDGIRRRIVRNLRSIDIVPLIYTLSEKAKESPAQAARLLDRYIDDPLRLVRDIRKAMAVEQ